MLLTTLLACLPPMFAPSLGDVPVFIHLIEVETPGRPGKLLSDQITSWDVLDGQGMSLLAGGAVFPPKLKMKKGEVKLAALATSNLFSASSVQVRLFTRKNGVVDVELPNQRTSGVPRIGTLTSTLQIQTGGGVSISTDGTIAVDRPSPDASLDVNGNVRAAYGSAGNHVHLRATGDDALLEHFDGGEPSAALYFNGFTGITQAQIVLMTRQVGDPSMVGRLQIDPDGAVQVFGNLTKGGGSFQIDHPLDPANKYLYHSFVESPDMMNVYNGNVVTDETGFAQVELPEYFEALNRDFRYQLTVIGQFAQAIVAEKVHDNRFAIRTDLPNVEVSWQITGIRQDPYAERHRIRLEVDKAPEHRGKYLHPQAYGLSSEHFLGPVVPPQPRAPEMASRF